MSIQTKLSVSQVNHFVKTVLSGNALLKRLVVEGEISNFKWHPSGHLYFSLKDAAGRLSCVMFRSDAENITFMPQDGMHIVCRGRIDVYERAGVYQLYVKSMKPAGVGDLYLAYEALKNKLDAEGYFDKSQKKPLPSVIRKIGVVTASTGAAIHDIISVAKRRDPSVAILLSPAQVQGKGAADSIVRAMARLEARDDIDVIIVGRGGGSIEDLWAFNEEAVAKAIFHSDKVIVSAVGHETDVTIADLVADLRAPTPSAAAELVTEDRLLLQSALANLTVRLGKVAHAVFDEKRGAVAAQKERLLYYSPKRLMNQEKRQLKVLGDRLVRAVSIQIKAKKTALNILNTYLSALNPENVLARGYAMVYDDKKLLVSAAGASSGDSLRIVLRDGEITARVTATDGEVKNGE